MNSHQGNSGASFLEMGGGEVAVTTLDEFVEGRGLQRLDFMKRKSTSRASRSGCCAGGERTPPPPADPYYGDPAHDVRAHRLVGSAGGRLPDRSRLPQLWRAQKSRLVPLEIVDRPGYLVNAFALPAEMQAQGVGASARG